MSLRLIFMGTPDFSVPTLLALHAAGHDIVAVYTREAKPGGRRGLELVPTPVEREARALGIPVLTPKSLKTPEAQAEFAALNADAAVVVAYGIILPKAVLEAPRLGCFNVHASILPRWRGAAPINRAIMAGDKESGVTIMQMDEGLDTGAMIKEKRHLFRSKVRIGAEMTAGDLHDLLMRVGANLMPSALAATERGTVSLKAQPEAGVTYAAKINKEEARIDWTKPWNQVRDHIRGLSPFPGAWFELDGVRVKVLRARRGARGKRKVIPGTTVDDKLTIACGDGAVRLVQIQRAGAKAMLADEFLRGTAVKAGIKVV
jgi:methionyl-tRNA formyltransferase